MRYFLSALLALFMWSGSANAFPPSPQYQYRVGQNVLAGPSPIDSLCSAVAGVYASRQTSPQCQAGTVFCTYTGSVYNGNSCAIVFTPGGFTDYPPIESNGTSCPANSVNQGGQCVCNAGFSEQGGKCVDANEQCKAAAGEISTMNYTRGWALSALPNKMDQLGATAKVPSGICNGGCRYAVLGNEAAYRSQTPSPQGLYRLSSDVTVIQTDQACSEQTAEVDPNTPNEPCPGTLGELNGKPYCAPGPNKPPPEGPPGEEPDDKGNPEAGKKPPTGEGSGQGGVGRTPTNGNGGNNGGPAGAAFGGSGKPPGADDPDGTTDKPDEGKEQENCGAPGQPACKLDESGTPGSFAPPSGVTEYKQSMDAAREQIKGAGDSIFGGMNVFFNAPAIAVCSPFSLPNDMGVIDPCAVSEGVRAVMAYIWALCAMWLCLGWIREAV